MENCGKEIEVNGETYVLKGLPTKKVLGPWEIGKKYFIRTVTMHLTGELVHVSSKELVLKDAAWIADSGRFNEFVKDVSKASEVEPFSAQVIVGRGSIVDATTISNIILSVK